MNISLYIKLLPAFLVIGMLQAVAQSDSTESDITNLSLDQLQNVKIVSASKTEMSAGQAPASSYVVTEEQIRIRGYRSLLDVIMDAPDFKVDDKIYSISRNIATMRGMDGQDKFIIMLDGVRISSPTNEGMPIMENYPVNLAKQIEIIYGPASALYGADAFAGIINIISRKSEYSSSKAEVSYSMGTQGLYNGNLFISKRIAKDVILTGSGQYFYDQGVDLTKQFKDDTLWNITSHRTGTFNTVFGPMTPTKAVQPGFNSPVSAYNYFAGLKAREFEFSVFGNHAQNPSAIENNPSNAVYNKDVFFGRGVNVYSARHSKTISNISFTTSLVASQYKEDPKTNYRNMFSGMEPAYKYAYGSMIQGEEQIHWKAAKGSDLVGGVVYQNYFSMPESADLQDPVEDSRSIEGTMLNTPSYYRPEGLPAKFYAVKYHNAGAYLQLQQKLGANKTLTVGARYDRNSRFGSTFNPRMGVVWNVTPKTTLKLMAGTAYLAPAPSSGYSYWGTFNTLDSGRTYQSYFFHLPNPTLKPSLTKNAEVSVRRYIGNNFSATLNAFYTSVTNLLELAPDEGTTNLYGGKFMGWNVDYIEVFVNGGREDIMGSTLQLAYNYNFRQGYLKAYSFISYVDGFQQHKRTDANGLDETKMVELDNNISHYMVKTGAEISFSNFSLSPRLIWASSQHLSAFLKPELPDKRQSIPGYALLNVALGYKLGKATVFANITNALNQKYRNVGPGMDLSNHSTELFYGKQQDPIRINGGIRITL